MSKFDPNAPGCSCCAICHCASKDHNNDDKKHTQLLNYTCFSIKNLRHQYFSNTVKPAYKNLVIKNLQAENSQIRPPIYENSFSLKLEIGSYLWRSSN